MDWFKKHVDTVVVMGGILACVFYMNSKFNQIDAKFVALEKAMDARFAIIENRFASIETRLVRMETVLFLKGIFPSEYAVKEEVK